METLMNQIEDQFEDKKTVSSKSAKDKKKVEVKPQIKK